MVREGALDSPKVEAVFGIHVDPMLDQGRVGWAAGAAFASSDRFVIEIKGKRTHGAYPHTGLDPIPVTAEVVLALEAMVARETDAQRPKVLTIGKIEGGERFNIVAERVRMEGTMRALDGAVRKDLQERMARVVTEVAKAHGAEGELRFATDGNPVLMNDETLVRRLVPSLEQALGRDAVVEVRPQMGAEDFAFFAERVPAFYCKLGVRNEAKGLTAMVHTERFDVDETVIGVGVKALTTLVWAELARR